MKLGNIVIKGDSKEFQDFNIFDSYEGVDNDLPTLIVGYDIINAIDPECDMLTRVVNHNTFWTFTMREKRDFHGDRFLVSILILYMREGDSI